ncbi:MAG: hypothetical protein H7267_05810 [Sandarakinorhabdus sp.]|nr:hypothetical protein [Sandarakinorhabdus sp.]
MSDLLAIGAAGVRAFQAALAQVGDNVANADTPGYVRRSLRISTGPAGAGTPLSRDVSGGAGVVSGEISRASDALAANTARVAAGDYARFAARADWLERLQTTVTGTSLDARIGGFFDAGTDLAAAPTAIAARTIFLTRTEQAASAFSAVGSGLASLADDLAAAITAETTTINAITAAIARVNIELRRTQSGGSAANGLLDSRDQLLAELATHLRISVTEADRGVVDVRLGTGGAAPLLVGTDGNPIRIGVRDGASGAEIILDPTHGATVVRLPASGSLAGLVEAARQVTATRTAIDTVATGFGTAINAWHSAGTDALGDPGTALLATRSLVITPGRANAGSAAIDVGVADDQQLAAAGYTLRYDASGYTLARDDGSASVTGPPTLNNTLTLDGVTVRPGAGARVGDSWALPIAAGAAGLGMRAIGAARLAVADRFLTDAAASNTGDAALRLTTDPAAAAFAPAPPYRITVTAAGAGILTDIANGTALASVTFDGTPVTAAGFTFTLTGTPAIGDSFRILAAGPASNDNGNARALSALRTARSFETGLDASLASIGAQLSETKRLQATALSVQDDTARAADAISGVDLDREAADLTRLQVAYRANAQVMAAARDMFDAMLAVLR